MKTLLSRPKSWKLLHHPCTAADESTAEITNMSCDMQHFYISKSCPYCSWNVRINTADYEKKGAHRREDWQLQRERPIWSEHRVPPCRSGCRSAGSPRRTNLRGSVPQSKRSWSSPRSRFKCEITDWVKRHLINHFQRDYPFKSRNLQPTSQRSSLWIRAVTLMVSAVETFPLTTPQTLDRVPPSHPDFRGDCAELLQQIWQLKYGKCDTWCTLENPSHTGHTEALLTLSMSGFCLKWKRARRWFLARSPLIERRAGSRSDVDCEKSSIKGNQCYLC